jgi:archaeal flagellar protein FlaI
MKFTDLRLEQIGETELGIIYKGLTHNFYELKEDFLSNEEKSFANVLERIIQMKTSFSDLNNLDFLPENFPETFREEIISIVEMYRLLEKIPSKKVFVKLLESLIRLISPIGFISNKALFSEKVLQNSVGLKQLSFFSLEKDFEELMVNSLEDIFVFHKSFGMCKVNINLNEKGFENILQRISHSVGKEFTLGKPLLDARLPDGSRVNATLDNVSPRGKSLTIRKFSILPLTIVDLIKSGSITSDAAAFLWLMVDGFGVNPKNILVVGGTSSGKTTLLTVLSNFTRLNERIVSIEDTLELSLLDRKNWVALEAKQALGENIGMDDLLKNSLRMRPDRLIIGEVRGKEAITLFTAMNNGHNGCLGTIHSKSARDTVKKLENKPFEIPSTMISLINLVVVMNRRFLGDGFVREVTQIAELSSMEDKVLLANLFEKNDGELIRNDLPSGLIESFAHESVMEKNDVKKEINTRKIILEWLLKNNVSGPMEVLEVIQSYYFNPEKVMSMIYNSAK